MWCSRPRLVVLAAIAIGLSSTVIGYEAPSQAATSSPDLVNDPHSSGAIAFYDAVGTPTTGGSDLTHLADYAQASTAGPGSVASLAMALVRPGESDPQLWPVSPTTAPTAFPISALGASVSSPSSPAASIGPTEGNLASFLTGLGVSTPVQVEVRLMSGDAQGVDPSRYWTSVLAVDPAAGTWTQVGQAQTQPQARSLTAATTLVSISTITANQAGHASLTATVQAVDGRHPDGAVHLFDDRVDLGAANYSTATGQASFSPDLSSARTHRYKFQFKPSSKAFSTACSPVLQITSSGGDFDEMRTAMVVLATPPSNNRAYGSAALSAWLTPASVSGTVRFTDSLGGILGSAKVQHGMARLLTNSLGAGKHVVTGQFTPAAGTCGSAVTASAAPFTLVGAVLSQDGQAATATVPAGQLSITTPYTPSHPFDLGSLVLNSAGSKLYATAHFGSLTDAATSGITINDSRAGNQPWTASVAATNFLHGSDAINAQNIGFVDVHQAPGSASGSSASTPTVMTHDLPAATQVQLPNAAGDSGLAGLPKAFASVPRGGGVAYLYGDVVLNAPTGTPPGTYNATLTFTVG